jgi:cation transport ATPase
VKQQVATEHLWASLQAHRAMAEYTKLEFRHHHSIAYCDMVLVSSHGMSVDESALTGESNPVAKTAVDPSDGTSILEIEGH